MDEKLSAYIRENFDMRPRAIIQQLNLLRPIYAKTASYGHFGRSEFSWEKTDRAKEIAAAMSSGGSRSVKPSGRKSGKSKTRAPLKSVKTQIKRAARKP